MQYTCEFIPCRRCQFRLRPVFFRPCCHRRHATMRLARTCAVSNRRTHCQQNPYGRSPRQRRPIVRWATIRNSDPAAAWSVRPLRAHRVRCPWPRHSRRVRTPMAWRYHALPLLLWPVSAGSKLPCPRSGLHASLALRRSGARALATVTAGWYSVSSRVCVCTTTPLPPPPLRRPKMEWNAPFRCWPALSNPSPRRGSVCRLGSAFSKPKPLARIAERTPLSTREPRLFTKS
mmetsp:Transcript_15422/g.46945  ORF Transcript_15422/g.46945 Transcript_15422/m.46945 type:complete len:232 (-) Transcript_15422:574-1269(-)